MTAAILSWQVGDPPWKFSAGGCRANDRGVEDLVGKLMQISSSPGEPPVVLTLAVVRRWAEM